MNIFSWNINRFDGNQNWKDDNNNYAVNDQSEDKRNNNFNQILNKIEEYIKDKDDIAFLQEVPYKNNEWNTWKQKIEAKGLKVRSWMYDVDDKLVNTNSINHTIAITQKVTNWSMIPITEREIVPDFGTSEAGKFNYANQYIEMKNKKEKMIILGVHSNNVSELHKALKNISACSRPDIMIGDFNAGDYPARDEFNREFVANRDFYISILRDYGYIDLCDGVTTFLGGTAIDHCLIKTVKTLSYDHIDTEVSDEKELADKEALSDHSSIKVKIKRRF